MLEKVFNSYDSVEMNHEYLCNYVQPLAVKFYLGLIDKNTVKNKLEELHGASIYYSEKSLWGDSSNKLSWLIGPLNELFPDAKFIHLIRDGRKVVNSFYNKLGNECYDDKSTSILQSWVEKPNILLEPPPEKKYWWNVVKKESPFYKKFNKYKDTTSLQKAIDKKVKWLNIKFGQGLIFAHHLMHGNKVNITNETRWSFNCRFKSLMSPYDKKDIAETFFPLIVRPATRVGLEYEHPQI